MLRNLLNISKQICTNKRNDKSFRANKKNQRSDQTVACYVGLSLGLFAMIPDGSPASSGTRLIGLSLVVEAKIQTNQKCSMLRHHTAESLKCI